MRTRLRDQLLSKQAREKLLNIANEAIRDPKVLSEIIEQFRISDYRLNQRISWVLALLAQESPKTIEPYQADLLDALNDEASEALKRNVLRIWNITGVHEDISGRVFDKCLEYLMGVNPIAVKAHAMEVAFDIAKPFPELKVELRPVIEIVLEREGDSAGIRSKARKVLKKL